MSAVAKIRILTISCAPPLYHYLQFPCMSQFLLKIFSQKMKNYDSEPIFDDGVQ